MAYIAKGKWRKSYKESQVNVYGTWCEFRKIPFEKPRYYRDENLPFILLEKELNNLISAVNQKTSSFLQLLKETGAESGVYLIIVRFNEGSEFSVSFSIFE